MDQKRAARAAAVARVRQKAVATAETDEQRKGRMAAALMAVVDASVAAAKSPDPAKAAVALANAQRALELAERLAPRAVAAGHTVLVQMPSDQDADGDSREPTDPQGPIQ